MAKNSYIVIFELTPAAGGGAFLRTRTDYESKEQFQTLYKPSDLEKIAAEGIEDTETDVFLCQTPAISFYLTAIEENFYSERPDWSLLEYQVSIAKYAAEHHVTLRNILGLEYSKPEGFVEHLAKISTGTDPKSRLMKAVIEAYDPETDYLHPTLMEINLLETIVTLTIPE